jgi:hypothetical protein
VDNEGEGIIQYVEFPKTLNLSFGENDRAYFPITYPGIMLGSEFIASGEAQIYECDYVEFLTGGVNMSVYQIYNDTCIQRVVEGLYAETDPGTPYNLHCEWNYLTWINGGDSWTSQVSRIRIGRESWEMIDGFRADNGIADYPSLLEKLGSKFDIYSRSPIYAYGFPHWDPPAFYYSDVPEQHSTYPSPAIYFLAMYLPARCKTCAGYAPDFYPPEPLLGTAEEFQNMIDTLQSRDYLVMLAGSSAWWMEDSPTMLNLPDGLTIQDIAVIERDSTVQYYSPDDPLFACSPSSPFVKQKNAEVYDIIFNTYGADMIFEDATMSSGPYDFNASAKSPVSIRQEWLDYYAGISDHAIVPEGAIIPMTESMTGIIGTSFGEFRTSNRGWDYAADDGFWRPYPLVSRLFGDKVISYPSYAGFTENKEAFAWYSLFACPFQIDMDEMSDRPYWIVEEHDGWIPVIHDFQGRVTSRIIGNQLIEYSDLDGPATLADYGDISIIKNWEPDTPYSYELLSIAPDGIYARSSSGDLLAGIFTRFNDQELSSGEHYLIGETYSDSIEVLHPMGGSTPVQIDKPAEWSDTDQIHIYSITRDSVKAITPTFEPDLIRFQLTEALADTTRILKYLILYGDTLEITSDEIYSANFNPVQSYPNPFSENTNIEFYVNDPGKVILRIYDLSGKEIRLLKEDYFEPGNYKVAWDGKNEQGSYVSSGMYFIDCMINKRRSFSKILKL